MPFACEWFGTLRRNTVFQAVSEAAGAPSFQGIAVIAAYAGRRPCVLGRCGEPFQNKQRAVGSVAARIFADTDVAVAAVVRRFVQPKCGTHPVQAVPVDFGTDFGTERFATVYYAV